MVQITNKENFKLTCEELGINPYCAEERIKKMVNYDDEQDVLGKLSCFFDSKNKKFNDLINHYIGILSLSFLSHLSANGIEACDNDSSDYRQIRKCAYELAWDEMCERLEELSAWFKILKND